jgi:acid phosphatase type 7
MSDGLDGLLRREMSRRDCLKLSGLVLGGVVLGTSPAFTEPGLARAGAAPQARGAGATYWAPWVTKLSPTSVTVNWRGDVNGSGSVDYAPAGYFIRHGGYRRTVDSPVAAQYQHVRLQGLEPNTEYVYRVRPSSGITEFAGLGFRTMPLWGPFSFIVLSDSQGGSKYDETKRFKYVAEAIAQETDPLFILHGGDCARFDDETAWTTFFAMAGGMLARFPIFTTVGNHEYHNLQDRQGPPTAAVQYHAAFDVPLHYSFDCCGVRFISLDTPDPANATEDDPQTSLALAQSQVPWLRDRLRSPRLGTFTIQHHPVWGRGRSAAHPDLQPWESLFHTYPISASFAGHIHDYQRLSVDGIPYFVLGTAGGPCEDMDPTDPIPPGYQRGETRKLGYLKVAVDPLRNTATAQQIAVGEVTGDDDNETPRIYASPVADDSVSFRLSPRRWSGAAPA